jgi:hypothetical protein
VGTHLLAKQDAAVLTGWMDNIKGRNIFTRNSAMHTASEIDTLNTTQ